MLALVGEMVTVTGAGAGGVAVVLLDAVDVVLDGVAVVELEAGVEDAAEVLEDEAVTDDDGIMVLMPPPQPVVKGTMANAQNRTRRRTIRLPIRNLQVGSRARQTVRGPLHEANWNFVLGKIGFCT
jgi:hypothetical protein